MSIVGEIVIVVVTIALVLIAWAALAWMRRVERWSINVRSSLARLEGTLGQARGVSGRVLSLLQDLEAKVSSLRATEAGIESAGGRAAGVLSIVLSGIERPVRESIGVARGVRAGLRSLKEGRSDGYVGRFESRADV